MANCVQIHTGCAWLGPRHGGGDHCIGIVYVPIHFLKFPQDLVRELNPAILANLGSVLQEEFNHDTCYNAIEGYIEYTEVSTITRKLGTSIDELLETTINGQRPILQHPVTCVDGQHRKEAARMAFGENTLWTVRLLCRPGVPLPIVLRDNATPRKLDSHSHQTQYSDGEVFRKVRRLWKEGNLTEARQWTYRLGVQKKINIEKIRDNSRIHSSLDELIPFPGLLDGLPLGSFHKHLALHCDDEIVSYLQRIRDVWLDISCNHPAVVDIATVQLLEGRAPKLSKSDRRAVKEAFDSSKAFTRVQDSQLRADIRRSLLRFRGVIPSLKSFHESMKYISIAVTVVLNLMYPESAQGRSWKREQTDERNDRWTLRSILRRSWSRPRQNLVETSEGLFVQCTGASSFKAAYTQLVLAALRNCSRLDPATVSMFYERAGLLGFQTPTVKMPGVSKAYTASEDGISDTLRSMKELMFLPQLSVIQAGETSDHSVQKDFVLSFFGAYDEYHMSSETVTIGKRPIGWTTTDQDMEAQYTEEGNTTHRPNTPSQDSVISMEVGTVHMQTVEAQHTVNVNRSPSVMSLSAAIHPPNYQRPVDEWLESSVLNAAQSTLPSSLISDHNFDASQVTRCWSQSRSGIDTPIHSWTGRLDSLKENQFLISPRTFRSRSPINTTASPQDRTHLHMASSLLSTFSRSAIDLNDYTLREQDDTPVQRALQSLNSAFSREPTLTPGSRSPTVVSSALARVLPSVPPASQPALGPGPALKPLALSSTVSGPQDPSLDRSTIRTSGSSTALSRSEIADRNTYASQAESSWFHLPPLKSYLPQLKWVSEPRTQTRIGGSNDGISTSNEPTSPYSSVSLTPASDCSRSVIGTPVAYQQGGNSSYQRTDARDHTRHHDKYWDIV
ncbi:hypothetical protein CT0861_03971 [Colletotrichum tofieldiae]|uniref:Uncharacterized protein n=1 Tax=Colletotrichum tofieldiae TaxID=708197 RepID=A0A161W8Q6_9PEZI|nr:hypothetical protein CT0861_03971 [Colletotrichum tofieldiae]